MFEQNSETEIISNKRFSQERALYNLKNTIVKSCTFAGEEDGESAFKESRNVKAENCDFCLRYPFWHTENFEISNSNMNSGVRASLWYSSNGFIKNTNILGVKCLRECSSVSFENCTVESSEFGWRCRDISIDSCNMKSEYYLFESRNVNIKKLNMQGKYSFQYTEALTVDDSILDTKDAFWHSKNVTVKNSVIKGEYLGWYSDGLTLINCRISGTQPFCYCKSLRLIDCQIEDADLAFEYSDVDAELHGHIISVKNPKSGIIKADSIGEIILENSVIDCNCEIITK